MLDQFNYFDQAFISQKDSSRLGTPLPLKEKEAIDINVSVPEVSKASII